MSVKAINPIYTGWKTAVILAKTGENVERPYLYNEILDITKKFKVPANFHVDKIELPTPTTDVIAKLNELGIKFDKIV